MKKERETEKLLAFRSLFLHLPPTLVLLVFPLLSSQESCELSWKIHFAGAKRGDTTEGVSPAWWGSAERSPRLLRNRSWGGEMRGALRSLSSSVNVSGDGGQEGGDGWREDGRNAIHLQGQRPGKDFWATESSSPSRHPIESLRMAGGEFGSRRSGKWANPLTSIVLHGFRFELLKLHLHPL